MGVKIKSALGSVTLDAENIASNTTVTVPAGGGTLATTGDVPTSIVDNGNATAITIDASENVGIGTSSPQARLDVTGTDFVTASISQNRTGTGSWNHLIDVSGNYVLREGNITTAADYFAVTTSGNVGIGTTSPNAPLSIYRSDSNRIIETTSYSTANQYHHVFQNNSGTLVGTITVSPTSTSYNTSSDYRLKENVIPMTGSIDRLKELKPSKFNFIADADTTVDGFLAHEAQEVVPECVTGTKDAMMTEEYEVTPAVMDGETVVTEAVMGEREVPDYQGIDQSKLVPLLVASLQEAVEKIEALETRVTQLENK